MISYLKCSKLPVELTALKLIQGWCLFLPEDLVQFVHFLDVHLCGVDLPRGGPVHVPERSLLTVQDLPLLLVPLLGHLGLGLRLHEDELPLPGEHLLKSSQVFSLVISQLEPRLVLHGSLTEIHGVVSVLRGPAVGGPEVGSLEPVERVVVVPHSHHVVVYREDVAVAGQQTGKVNSFPLLAKLVVGLDP